MTAAATGPTDLHGPSPGAGVLRVALVGNPNTGKTSLFNRLSGLRHKTANFPGTTQEYRLARAVLPSRMPIDLIDLPGVYSLGLDQSESALCRAALAGALGRGAPAAPDAVCIVIDATRPARGLRLVAEVAHLGLPVAVALNMTDAARKQGPVPDAVALAAALGCPVVACSARTGEGVAALPGAMAAATRIAAPADPAGVWTWAERLVHRAGPGGHAVGPHAFTERADRLLLHPVAGSVAFAAVMGFLFWTVFQLATVPMDLIDTVFAAAADAVKTAIPEGDVADLLADGIIAGVGATLVFLPQICILFFLIALLEGTGYLARAALLMDRLLRPFGLPGHSFVPMLSAHACAIPAIMACRGIPGRGERLATILVAPFLSCSARIPVYVLLTGVLFADRPGMAALAFGGCYALGGAAALTTAVLFRRTILRGGSAPMALDLPDYRRPGIRSALLTTWDRARSFLRKAGTVIVALMVVLWWLGAYPHVKPPPEVAAMRQQAAQVQAADPAAAAALVASADRLESRHAGANTFLGRIGRAAQPAFAPLGYDWQVTVGVLGSFAAREVFVSTLAVVVAGSDDVEDAGVLERIRTARRDDGTPVLTPAASWSLLVFFVLAMQCLPTLAVTAREAGGWRWAALQFGWMSGLAYAAAFATFHLVGALGA